MSFAIGFEPNITRLQGDEYQQAGGGGVAVALFASTLKIYILVVIEFRDFTFCRDSRFASVPAKRRRIEWQRCIAKYDDERRGFTQLKKEWREAKKYSTTHTWGTSPGCARFWTHFATIII